MRRARRGGHLDGEKIQPGNVDFHVQALRLQLIANDLDKAGPRWVKKDNAGGKGRQVLGHQVANRTMR